MMVTCNDRYMQTRKDELIEALIAYLLEHGLSQLSLRPLAAEIGTSARLLVYHFESKEGLMTDVLAVMQSRLRESFSRMADAKTREDGPLLKVFWNWALDKKNFGYLKLLYELQILAIQNPTTYAQYLERNSLDWLDLIERALPPSSRGRALATLFVAVFDGLFLELLNTGDRKRTTQALDEFIRIASKARENE